MPFFNPRSQNYLTSNPLFIGSNKLVNSSTKHDTEVSSSQTNINRSNHFDINDNHDSNKFLFLNQSLNFKIGPNTQSNLCSVGFNTEQSDLESMSIMDTSEDQDSIVLDSMVDQASFTNLQSSVSPITPYRPRVGSYHFNRVAAATFPKRLFVNRGLHKPSRVRISAVPAEVPGRIFKQSAYLDSTKYSSSNISKSRIPNNSLIPKRKCYDMNSLIESVNRLSFIDNKMNETFDQLAEAISKLRVDTDGDV